MISVILVIDAGSSSIRCTGYEYRGIIYNIESNEAISCAPEDASTGKSATTTSSDGAASSPSSNVKPLDGMNHTIEMTSVIPNTGHIRIHEVLDAIDKCIDEVLQLLRDAQQSNFRIVAVGFSTFAMNLCGVDRSGDPLGEVATLSYACNRDDVVKACENLKRDLGHERVDALEQRTGAPLHPAYAIPQLLAFYSNKENESLIKKLDKWKSISSICLFRWVGRPHLQIPISYSEASWTGMLDYSICTWDEEVVDILEECNVAPVLDPDDENFDECFDILPPLLDFDAALPFLREPIPPYCDNGNQNGYYDRWPEFRSPLNLFFGFGDGAAANMGSKCYGGSSDTPHRIAVTVGTSAAARVCLPLPIRYMGDARINFNVPQGLFCYRVDRHRVLVGGALTDGGSLVEWARSLLNLSPEEFDACMEQVSRLYHERCSMAGSPVDAPTGLTMIPFLSGERSTGFRGGAQGCISGITRETTAVDIMYACLESVVIRLHSITKLVNKVCSQESSGAEPSRGILVASGNAFERNDLWRQMLADCTSMDVIVDADSAAGTSRGVANMLAGAMQQKPRAWNENQFTEEEPLRVAHEAKAKTSWPSVNDYWKSAVSSQEDLIHRVAPTWKDGR